MYNMQRIDSVFIVKNLKSFVYNSFMVKVYNDHLKKDTNTIFQTYNN